MTPTWVVSLPLYSTVSIHKADPEWHLLPFSQILIQRNGLKCEQVCSISGNPLLRDRQKWGQLESSGEGAYWDLAELHSCCLRKYWRAFCVFLESWGHKLRKPQSSQSPEGCAVILTGPTCASSQGSQVLIPPLFTFLKFTALSRGSTIEIQIVAPSKLGRRK